MNSNVLLNFSFFYTIIIKQALIYYTSVIFFSFFFKKKIHMRYCYFIKTKIPNLKIFNSTLILNSHILNNLNIKVTLKLNLLKKSKNRMTTLRSPFVHKISKEQFVFLYYEGVLSFHLKNINNFIIWFLEFFLKKISAVWLCSKSCVKRSSIVI